MTEKFTIQNPMAPPWLMYPEIPRGRKRNGGQLRINSPI